MEPEISVADFHKIKRSSPGNGRPAVCLLDVRELWESSMAVLPESVSIPMGELPERAHRELKQDAHIVVYCHHGHRSLAAVMWLREQGFSRSQSLAGGIDAWSREIDPSIDLY